MCHLCIVWDALLPLTVGNNIRILVVIVTGRWSTPHVTSGCFYVDTFWSGRVCHDRSMSPWCRMGWESMGSCDHAMWQGAAVTFAHSLGCWCLDFLRKHLSLISYLKLKSKSFPFYTNWYQAASWFKSFFVVPPPTWRRWKLSDNIHIYIYTHIYVTIIHIHSSIYIYIHVWLVLLGGCWFFHIFTTSPGVCPCSSYDDTAVTWRWKISYVFHFCLLGCPRKLGNV